MTSSAGVATGVIEVVSPATLERVGSVRETEPAELEELLAEARHAQGVWAREPLATRKAVLRRVAREIVSNDVSLARLIVDETGKPLVEAYTHDLFVAVEELLWLADRLEGVLSPRRPLINEGQRARVEGLVADAIEHGAEPASARLRQEELFGPVATVVSIDNNDEAVQRANESRYALGASIWTRDVKQGRELGQRVRAGFVWLNDHLYSFSAGQAPWGGRGASGVGRTHGRQGLESMSHVKFTDSDRGWIAPGWWYPYSEKVVDGFRGVLGGLHADGAGARLRALSDHRRGLAHLVRKALL